MRLVDDPKMDFDSLDTLIARYKNLMEKQIFFIGGAQKSGSTWLQRMLDSHPEIVCSGEGHFADKVAVPISQIMKDYNQYLDLVSERVYEHKPCYSQYTNEEFILISTLLIGMMINRREIADRVRCVGDKTPIHVTLFPVLLTLFPNAKFIHLIRDGRDVVVSLVKHAHRVLKTDSQGEWNMRDKTPDFAKKWAHYVQYGRTLSEKFPNNCYEVRYEDLLSKPEATLGKTLDFLGVDHSNTSISTCLESSSFSSLSGGRSNGEEDNSSFYRKGIAGDWKNHMDEETLKLFMATAGPLLNELGY